MKTAGNLGVKLLRQLPHQLLAEVLDHFRSKTSTALPLKPDGANKACPRLSCYVNVPQFNFRLQTFPQDLQGWRPASPREVIRQTLHASQGTIEVRLNLLRFP